MKITILGTGTSQGIPVISCTCNTCNSKDPKDKRLRSSVLIEVDNTHIVIDTGPDFRQQMLSCKNKKLNAILITHEHNDHIIGLDDIRPYKFILKQAIDVYAMPRVIKEIQTKFAYAFNNPYPGAPKIKLKEIVESKPFQVNGIDIIPINVKHNKLSILGYRIGDFVYITDASFVNSQEFSKLRNVKYLIINSLRPGKHPSHFSLPEALAFIDKVRPEQAFLTHISHYFPPQSEWSTELPARVHIAYDGLVINV